MFLLCCAQATLYLSFAREDFAMLEDVCRVQAKLRKAGEHVLGTEIGHSALLKCLCAHFRSPVRKNNARYRHPDADRCGAKGPAAQLRERVVNATSR